MTTGMHACMQREAKYCVGQFALIGAVSSAIAEWAAARRFEGSASAAATTTTTTTTTTTATAAGAASSSLDASPSMLSSVGIATLLDESLDLRTLLSSISVGFLCTIISQPDDVVKTRQQTRIAGPSAASAAPSTSAAAAGNASLSPYRSYWGSITHVASTEGAHALWRGAFWRCCVRVPLGLSVINFVHPRLRPLTEAALS